MVSFRIACRIPPSALTLPTNDRSASMEQSPRESHPRTVPAKGRIWDYSITRGRVLDSTWLMVENKRMNTSSLALGHPEMELLTDVFRSPKVWWRSRRPPPVSSCKPGSTTSLNTPLSYGLVHRTNLGHAHRRAARGQR